MDFYLELDEGLPEEFGSASGGQRRRLPMQAKQAVYRIQCRSSSVDCIVPFRRKYLKGLLSIPSNGRGARRPLGQSFRESVGPAEHPLLASSYPLSQPVVVSSGFGESHCMCQGKHLSDSASSEDLVRISAKANGHCLTGCGKSLNRDDSPPQGLKPSLILHDLRGAKAPLYHSAAGFRDFFRSLLRLQAMSQMPQYD